MISHILKGLIDLIYPPRCPLCDSFVDKGGSPCASCAASLHGLDADADMPHLRRRWIGRCVSCFAYEGRLKDALHGFKYQKRLDQVRYFGEVLVRKAAAHTEFDVVMPVPMHSKKLRSRGFNQAALLAKYLGKKRDVVVDFDSLRRTRDERPQVGLERAERLRNIKGAFEIKVKGISELRGKNIILIDDVLTTGATINECARILKKAGASSVSGLTVARTPG